MKHQVASKGDGALVLTPDAKAAPNARPFLAHSKLDLAGPITATLRIRAKQGGASTFTWRTKQEPDFLPTSAASFDWPASDDWREVEVQLPARGRVIHLRLTPAKASTGLEVLSIELRGSSGSPQMWRFDQPR